jgi:hypothetical protein
MQKHINSLIIYNIHSLHINKLVFSKMWRTRLNCVHSKITLLLSNKSIIQATYT